MTPTISVNGLSRRYRNQLALDDITLDVHPSITGLLGRNGAGKSTLMRIIAAQEFPSAGNVSVFGCSPMENDEILRRMVLVREDQAFADIKVRRAIEVSSWFHPNWSSELAGQLMADFELPGDRLIKKLSREMRSALGIVIGLAARAELTLFDEPYAGLDAVARQLFYDRMLADYTEYPRTVLLSTHLIDEVADLLERVVIIDHGRIMLDAAADDIRGSVTTVGGSVAAVEEFVAGRVTWDRRRIASQESVVLVATGGSSRRRSDDRCAERKEERMTTWINVARYHLVQRLNYLVLPWAVLVFAFVVDVVILKLAPAGHSGQRDVGGVGSIFVLLFVLGLQSVARSLPLGLAFGISRRSYYLGTALLAIALGIVYGLALTVGQVVERATNGWGLSMNFFRVPYILNGPWYLTWLTSAVALALLFVYGMWFGLVFRRWNVIGLVAFIAGQITLLLAGALATTWSHGWPSIGHFFSTLSASGLTAVLAALAAALFVGGFATMRRVTV